MNKDLINQLPADEQPLASKLDTVAEDMELSPSFEWELETQLMEKYKTKSGPKQAWFTKLTFAAGWAILAIGSVFLLTWTIRSVTPMQLPATEVTTAPQISFEDNVRQGNICTGPLALAHNFAVYLSNEDKTGFETLDEHRTIGELRTFSWSPDGEQLAVLGNTAGSGNIYLTDIGKPLQVLLSNSEVGYLRGVNWSHDGKQLLLWSSQNISIIYTVNADGNDLIERHLDAQIFPTPQFAPDGGSIIFLGANSTSAGLFEFQLDGSQTRLISSLVENASGFAWSPDGRYLAYFIVDRTLGEAQLLAEEFSSGKKAVLATLPIPKGSGSSVPDITNLSWSQNGTKLVFEFGRSMTERVIYLAHADGTGLVKLADAAHAPAISADGNCLAYISNKQVFLIDLTSTSSTPLLLADLPAGRSNADFRLDKLQWRP